VCAASFEFECIDNGTLIGADQYCIPRLCDCPGEKPCQQSQIECGIYRVPPSASVATAEHTPTTLYTFGDTLEIQCDEGYRLSDDFRVFAVETNGLASCGRSFIDTCTAVGKFRSQFLGDPCVTVTCPNTAKEGVNKDDDRPLVFYSEIVIETCQPGYVPSKVVPSRSICQATCQLSETLQCRQADCAPKPFDYSDCVVVQVCAARADLYHKCHHDAAE
jgi:hypothetical protein